MKPALLTPAKFICFLTASVFMGLITFIPVATLVRMAAAPLNPAQEVTQFAAFFISLLVCAGYLLFLVNRFGFPARKSAPATAVADGPEWPEF